MREINDAHRGGGGGQKPWKAKRSRNPDCPDSRERDDMKWEREP